MSRYDERRAEQLKVIDAYVRPLAQAGERYAAIAEKTGLTPSQVEHSVRRLKHAGVVVRKRAAAKPSFNIVSDAGAVTWVLKEVAARHDTTVKDILSSSRFATHIKARQDAMYRLHVELGMSVSAVGRRMNKDHTTIRWGVARHRDRTPIPSVTRLMPPTAGNFGYVPVSVARVSFIDGAGK